MPAPGMSGKMPQIRKTVLGQRLSTAAQREQRATREEPVATERKTPAELYLEMIRYRAQPSIPMSAQQR